MPDTQFNPGSADVIEAIMTSHDGTKSQNITGQITEFSLSQSMNSASYNGSLTLLDSISLFEGFPIRGEETIELKLQGHDLNTEVKIKTHVYSVDNITVDESSNKLLFTINFVSNLTYKASKRRVIKSFQRKSMDQIARLLFNTYFGPLGEKKYLDPVTNRTLEYAAYVMPITEEDEKNFILQPTANMTNCTIPNYVPVQAMQFLSNQCFQPETPSCSFKFFETVDNFYFCTDEYFIKTAQRKEIIDLFYAPASSYDPRKPLDQINRIEELTIINKGLNTGHDIFSGAYKNKTTEVDLIRRKLVTKIWGYDKDAKYIDMSGSPRNIADDTHTPKFREDTFTDENARDFLVFKDYQQNGDIPSSLHTDRFMPQIIANRLSYKHHLGKTTLAAKMKGRLDIRPGMIVNLDITNLDGVANNAERNQTMSGKYLVETVNHNRDSSGTLHCGLRLQKFGWSKGEVDV